MYSFLVNVATSGFYVRYFFIYVTMFTCVCVCMYVHCVCICTHEWLKSLTEAQEDVGSSWARVKDICEPSSMSNATKITSLKEHCMYVSVELPLQCLPFRFWISPHMYWHHFYMTFICLVCLNKSVDETGSSQTLIRRS